MIEGRQDIGYHRETKHQIYRKVWCKFYPSCLDGNECFFVHEQTNQNGANSEAFSPFCPLGEQCSNQSCGYSESSHKMENEVQCRFQGYCNRKFCTFKHLVERRAFLGESLKRGQRP